MNIPRMHNPPTERPLRPRMHLYPLLPLIPTFHPNSHQHTPRIPSRLLQRGVAVHGADAQEAERGVVRCEEDGEGVLVGIGIGIDWRREGRVHTSWPGGRGRVGGFVRMD